MLPFITLGPVSLPTYGLFAALGFIVLAAVTKQMGKRSGIQFNDIFDLMFWCVIVGVAGARLTFVIPHWDLFRDNPLRAFMFWEGGMVFLGSLFAFLPFSVWYCRKYGLRAWNTLDTFAPGMAFSHGVARLGCVAAGCCHGKPTGGDWGLVFNGGLVAPELQGIPLHPTQLYEAGALMVLGGLLVVRFYRRQFEAQVITTYAMAYAVIRSVIEVYRGDSVRGYVVEGWVSTGQFMSALMFAAAAALYWYRSRRGRTGMGSAALVP